MESSGYHASLCNAPLESSTPHFHPAVRELQQRWHVQTWTQFPDVQINNHTTKLTFLCRRRRKMRPDFHSNDRRIWIGCASLDQHVFEVVFSLLGTRKGARFSDSLQQELMRWRVSKPPFFMSGMSIQILGSMIGSETLASPILECAAGAQRGTAFY